MVRALIELNDETNQILNIVKAKHGLKDKSQAIEFIVKKHQDKETIPELKYFNDGDKWFLAEDIPDIDFYFAQIWLSGFVNELSKYSGKGYKKILAVYKVHDLLFYYGEKDSYEVGEHLSQRFVNESGFIEKTNEEIIKVSDELRAFCEKLPERNLDKLSNTEIWNIYDQHDKIHTEYYQWGWMPVCADMFHNNFTNKLKQYLKDEGIKEEKVNEYFITLTQPREKSLIQIEQEEFLQIAALIRKDKYHRELFEELFKRFKEQDIAKFGYKTHTKEYEDLLEKKVSDLVTRIKPEIFNKIKQHYEKYFYVNRMWIGKPYTLEYYIKELVKLIGNKSDVEEALKSSEKDFKTNREKRNNLIKELKLEEKWKKIFDGFGDFMVTKIYRRFAQIYALYKMDFLQKEIAKRFNISLMQVRFMLPQEVKKVLLQEIVDHEELKDRTEFCVYYAEKGKDVIYTGVKAKTLAAQAEKVETKDITELKGQTACMGKAKGKVKIIIRPDDMAKMKQGDILVSIATDPDIVPAMKKAAAIVTEQGGVTSHAAIVSRELGTPCVIGTKIATKVLKDGDLVEVNADKGIVKILKKA